MDNVSAAALILGTSIVIAIIGYFLAPNNPYDKSEKVKNDSQKFNLSVTDGIRFGFGFGLGIFLWLTIVSVASIFFGGVLIKSLFEGFQLF